MNRTELIWEVRTRKSTITILLFLFVLKIDFIGKNRLSFPVILLYNNFVTKMLLGIFAVAPRTGSVD